MKKWIINQLSKTCSNNDFSIEEAESLIKQVNINKPFNYPHEIETTLLDKAIEHENIKMVEVLLKNGANPNLIHNDENALWNLQYPNFDYEGERGDVSDENRIKIAQMLLDYGANPNIVLDEESLFNYVAY